MIDTNIQQQLNLVLSGSLKPADFVGREDTLRGWDLYDNITHLSGIWDRMARVGVNGCGHLGHLVARAIFNSGKVDTVAISDHLIDINYTVYMFHFDSTHHNFHGTRPRSLSSVGRLFPSFRIEIPPISSGVMLVWSMVWIPLVSSLSWRRPEPSWRVEFKGSTSLHFCWCPHVLWWLWTMRSTTH